MASLYAGTSGFAYPAWKPEFYPADVAASRFLEHYAARLNCVEINYTFRRTPRALDPRGLGAGHAARLRLRRQGAPAHHARGAPAGRRRGDGYFLTALEPLREAGKLGPVLFQLPPYLHLDLARLAAFLELLPDWLRATIEFRHDSWFTDEVFDLLRGHGVALCVAETEKLTVPEVVTADFVYERLRKPAYSDDELAAIAARSRRLLAAGLDVYLVFKHDETPSGALEAEALLQGGLKAAAPRSRRCRGGSGSSSGRRPRSVTQAIRPETRITMPATTSEMVRPVRKAP